MRCVLWNPKIFIQKGPGPILGWMNPVSIHISYFFNYDFNVIFPIGLHKLPLSLNIA
jgi:hypothetical protein